MPTLGADFPLGRLLASAACALVTASANCGGVRSPAGRLTQSRVAATAAATTWASSKAAIASALRAAELRTTTSLASVDSAFVSCLYSAKV